MVNRYTRVCFHESGGVSEALRFHGFRKEAYRHRDLFRFTDEQFGRIEPHLLTYRWGDVSVEDRRVLSGIFHIMSSEVRWRGGRSTIMHLLADTECRRIAFVLTGVPFVLCAAGEALTEATPDTRLLNGEAAYGSNAIRRRIEERFAMPTVHDRTAHVGKPHSCQAFDEPEAPSGPVSTT